MISPETLRRYPYFGPFSDDQLREIAMIADEITAKENEVIFEECGPADALYLLMEGSIDLSYKSQEEYHPKASKVFTVGEVNPGEIFSLSSLIEPFVLNATATASEPSKLNKIDAKALRQLLDNDPGMGYAVMQQIAKAMMERLAYTRVQLAAAWA